MGDNVSDEYKKQSDEIDNLLAFAKDFDMEEMTENFYGKIIMSNKYSEKFREAIEDYDDETFWHELESRLGKRDFNRIVTKEEIKEMEENGGWYPDRIHELYEKYRKEFEEHGLDNIEFVK